MADSTFVIRFKIPTGSDFSEGVIVQKGYSRSIIEEMIRGMNEVYGEGSHKLVEISDRAVFYFRDPSNVNEFIDTDKDKINEAVKASVYSNFNTGGFKI